MMRENEMNRTARENDEIFLDFVSILGELKRHWWNILLMAAAGIFLGLAVTLIGDQQTPDYSSQAVLALVGTEENNSVSTQTAANLSKPVLNVFQSSALSSIVAEKVGSSGFSITAQYLTDTNLIQVTSKAGSAQVAFQALKAAMEEYPKLAGSMISDVNLITLERPQIPQESLQKSDLLRSGAIGGGLAALLYMGVVVLLSILQNTVKRLPDLEQKTGARLLGGIPLVKQENTQAAAIWQCWDTRTEEQYQFLTRRISQELKKQGTRRMALVSARHGEGKTQCILGLAHSMAKRNLRVLVVEADPAGTPLKTEESAPQALTDALARGRVIREDLIPLEEEAVWLLAGQKDREELLRQLTRENVSRLLENAEEQFDYVLVDAGAVARTADTAMIAEQCGAAVLLVAQDCAPAPELWKIRLNLEQRGILLGAVYGEREPSLVGYWEEENIPPQEADEEELDLIRLLRYGIKGLGRYWKAGVALTAVLAVGGLAYGMVSYQPVYSTSASVQVVDSLSGQQSSGQLSLTAQNGKTAAYILSSNLLRDKAAQSLGLEQVGTKITATPVENTNLLSVTATDQDPQMAYELLQEILNQYHQVSDYVLGSTQIQVTREPTMPSAPAGHGQETKYALYGAAAGILVWGFAAGVYALTRNTISSSGEGESVLGAQCLACIRWSRKRQEKPFSGEIMERPGKNVQAFEESFRNLANALERHQAETGSKVFLFSAIQAGEEGALTALNTALILAQRNRRVLLVEGDLRDTSLSRKAGLGNAQVNLQTVLTGQKGLAQAAVCLDGKPLFVLPGAKTSGGREVLNLLSGKEFSHLLEEAKKEFDYILVEAPALNAYAEGYDLAALCQGGVLVVKQDGDTLAELSRTAVGLAGEELPLLGFAFCQSR